MINGITNESEAVVEVHNYFTLLYLGAGVHLARFTWKYNTRRGVFAKRSVPRAVPFPVLDQRTSVSWDYLKSRLGDKNIWSSQR